MAGGFPQFPHIYPVDDWDRACLTTSIENHLRSKFSRHHEKHKGCLVVPHTIHLETVQSAFVVFLLFADALDEAVLQAVQEQVVEEVEYCMKMIWMLMV